MWNLKSANIFFQSKYALQCIRNLSNKSAYVTKIHRALYLRSYPTVVVEPNGSTYTVRHYEPRRIIKLPLDLSTIDEDERTRIIESRKPKKKVVIEEEVVDDFDSKKYLRYIKKRV